MEKFIGAAKWKWFQFTEAEIDRINPLIENEGYGCKDWLEQVGENRTNCLRVRILENGKKVVNGSLIYKQSFKQEGDYRLFHFYVTKDQWISVDLELSALRHIDEEGLLRKIDRTENAVDGFLLFLGELMNEMLVEIDGFEAELKSLIWSIRKKNETGLLEFVYMRRHELLVWKSLLIPIQELKMAIDEIALHRGGNHEIFRCTAKRIERAFSLLNEYEHEIDSIIKLEEVISSHRGNEIMKTLTVITTIFTPIMAFGALWGMNFRNMPELEWRFGYIFSILLIIISTVLLYGYLKVKGWTGDLLKGRKKGSFFK
ncbi:magnesium transporter CorA family protein [Neobacillus novalis]|uniref:Magnesium transporter CorA family protein n=1 Tax=Neobacillus novalis TaxID=220687 RepID=A0AA95MMV2_9BACI|nr:magnesium transporter CorA family protein [Neobacillus novalis]WHY86147.1 magnesium transporter CorA family protein [Neobacillus novalis]